MDKEVVGNINKVNSMGSTASSVRMFLSWVKGSWKELSNFVAVKNNNNEPSHPLTWK